jgi:hypothetical protein
MNRDICRGLASAFCARADRNYRWAGIYRWIGIAAGVLASFFFAAMSHAAPLYNGSSNLLPSDSAWHWGYYALNLSNPFTAVQATATASGGVTTLDTTPTSSDAAGFETHISNLLSPGLAYSDPDVVPLDRSTGFELDFSVKLLSETHNSADRAGFSVIALSSDASPMGIELGFWTNEVWAQNAGFTHGESSRAFDTTAGLIDYRLAILGNSYTLFADNSQILNGSLRDYTAFNGGPPFNSGFPYNQSNFTFFGDDTSSANAKVQIASFNVVTVPEPAGFGLALEASIIMVGAFGVLFRQRRHQPVPAMVRQRHF